MGRSKVSEWVTFKTSGKSPSGKTKLWGVYGIGMTLNKRGGVLGTVHWFARWRQYAFSPVPNTVFNKDCLRFIASFCERQTKLHNAALRTARKKGTLK